MGSNVEYDTTLIVFILWANQPLAGFLSSGGSSIYEDAFNGLYLTMFTSSTDSTVHPEPSDNQTDIPFINCPLRRDATLLMVLLSCIIGSLLLTILIPNDFV